MEIALVIAEASQVKDAQPVKEGTIRDGPTRVNSAQVLPRTSEIERMMAVGAPPTEAAQPMEVRSVTAQRGIEVPLTEGQKSSGKYQL